MLPESVQRLVDAEIAANHTDLTDLRVADPQHRLRHVDMLHTARRPKDAGGLPAHGIVVTSCDLSRTEDPNPEYR